jgi:hypothetical protein
MGVAFYRGQALGRDDLCLTLESASGTPTNAAEISYAIYDFTTHQEVLVGVPRRMPANPAVGEYYASLLIPLDANLGVYRLRWTFRESVGAPIQQVVMEFEVIDKVTSQTLAAPGYTQTEADLMRRLRILLRDNNPDRNYHFRPPAHEETVRQFNRVFGYIWEDGELKEFIERSLDMISSAPPATPFANVETLVAQRPNWRTLLLTGAMMHALQAVRINWIADEFSVAGEQEVRVVLPDGTDYDISMEELYGLRIGATPKYTVAKKIQRCLLSGKLRVRSVYEDTKDACLAYVGDVLRHNAKGKKILKITTKHLGGPLHAGYKGGSVSVICTEDHSLYSVTSHGTNGGPGRVFPVKAGDLQTSNPIVSVFKRDGGLHVGYRQIAEVAVLPEREFMYDLSVPGPQNFALSNGLLAHNSYSIGGVSLDIDKASKYEAAFQSTSEQFDKQLEKTKATVNIIKGLQQPKYGTGIRSAFGPYVGAGVLSPRKFVGF